MNDALVRTVALVTIAVVLLLALLFGFNIA